MATRADGLLSAGGPVGVLADDLTGAGDTVLAFDAPGRALWILPEVRERLALGGGVAAVALNTASRHLTPADAAGRVDRGARLLASLGCVRFYKKVDSTLRGHIAAETLQALGTLGYELAVIAPAFPAAGRQTVGGYQLVGGLPVSASAYAADPLAPVRESHLPSLLAETAPGSVLALGLRDVMSGPEAIAGAIVRAVSERRRLLVVDAARDEDLRAIARAIALTPYRVLPVGSAGLALALSPGVKLGAPREGELLLASRRPVLVVSGSLNPVTREQVRRLSATAHLVSLDVQGLLLTERTARERITRAVLTRLLAGQDVVLASGASDEAARKEQSLGRDLAMAPEQAGAHLVAAIGAIVAEVVADTPLSGLVLAGGDTALGACLALGGGPMRVQGEIAPSVPLCRLEREAGALRVVTKSGGFGGPDALVEIVTRLKRLAAD